MGGKTGRGMKRARWRENKEGKEATKWRRWAEGCWDYFRKKTLKSRRREIRTKNIKRNIQFYDNWLILSEYCQHRLSFYFILKRGQEVVCFCPLTSSSSCVYTFSPQLKSFPFLQTFPLHPSPTTLHPSALL